MLRIRKINIKKLWRTGALKGFMVNNGTHNLISQSCSVSVWWGVPSAYFMLCPLQTEDRPWSCCYCFFFHHFLLSGAVSGDFLFPLLHHKIKLFIIWHWRRITKVGRIKMQAGLTRARSWIHHQANEFLLHTTFSQAATKKEVQDWMLLGALVTFGAATELSVFCFWPLFLLCKCAE